LLITNDETESETGFFFKATPFVIKSGETTVTCTFKRGTEDKVVYALESDGKLLEELHHSDYVPDYPPEKIKEELIFVFAALTKLGVSNDKTYQSYLGEKKLGLSYEVTQEEPYIIP